jgi:hypothetical protein
MRKDGRQPKKVVAHISFTEMTDTLRGKFCPELRLPFEVAITSIFLDYSNQMVSEIKIDRKGKYFKKRAEHPSRIITSRSTSH